MHECKLSIYTIDLLSIMATSINDGVNFLMQEYTAPYTQLEMNSVVHNSKFKQAIIFWKKDLERLQKEIGGAPDHFKQSGHLCYWLRRMQPITEVFPKQSIINQYGNNYFIEYSEVETTKSKLLIPYKNEYMAFNIMFRICKAYEERTQGRKIHIPIDDDYLLVTAHFLKEKNVSPHALALIYKSLFLGR